MDKVEPCIDCGELIFPSTAKENKGLCTPCLEVRGTVNEDWPHKYAFWAAAFLLLINAGFTIFQMYFDGSSTQHVIRLTIDVTLALFLIQEDEIARLATLIRAALGLVVPIAIRVMEGNSAGIIETGIAQTLFCGSLILFLGWKSVSWRVFPGVFFGLLYSMYLGLIVVTLVF